MQTIIELRRKSSNQKQLRTEYSMSSEPQNSFLSPTPAASTQSSSNCGDHCTWPEPQRFTILEGSRSHQVIIEVAAIRLTRGNGFFNEKYGPPLNKIEVVLRHGNLSLPLPHYHYYSQLPSFHPLFPFPSNLQINSLSFSHPTNLPFSFPFCSKHHNLHHSQLALHTSQQLILFTNIKYNCMKIKDSITSPCQLQELCKVN